MHGGAIAAESKLGLGSAFHVRLPTAEKAQLARPTPSMSAALPEGISGSFQSPVNTH
jgi:hypothetical protein